MPPSRTRTSRVPEATQEDVSRRAAATRDQPAEGGDVVDEAKRIFAGELPHGVRQKLNMILRAMPDDMRPEGNNKHFHYDYWTLDQISGFFRSRFRDLELDLDVDVVEYSTIEHPTKEGRSMLTTLRVLFTVTDIETGEQVSGHGLGQGDDPGDKGANKAMSGALKYWLLKRFLVGGEDAEADERTDRRDERDERRSSSRGRDDDERRVKIGPSSIEGIQRGGRANKTTDAQIRQIRELAKDLNWNAIGAARRIAEWLGDELEMPQDAEEARDALVRYLEGLDADDAGKIITKMVDLRDTPEDDTQDDRGDPGYGY